MRYLLYLAYKPSVCKPVKIRREFCRKIPPCPDDSRGRRRRKRTGKSKAASVMTMETLNIQTAEKVDKFSFAYRTGRRILAFALAAVLLGSMMLAWEARVRDLRKAYVGSALEYAAQVLQSNTGYLNEPAVERAWQILTNAVRKPKTYEEFETYASLSIAKGEYKEAIGYLEHCIDLYSGDSDRDLALLWLRKGSLFTLTEDFETAQTCFDQALQLDENIPDAYLLRAQMESELGNTEAAVEDLQNYEALAGTQPVIQAALGGLYESAQDFENAEKCYTQAISSENYEVNILAARGRCRILLGDTEGALRDLERYLREGGEDPTGDVHAMLGMCRMEAQRYEDARKSFDAAIRAGYADEKLLWVQRVACDYILKDYDAVIRDGEKALELMEAQGGTDGEMGELNQWIGFSYFIKNDYEAALRAFEQALKQNAQLTEITYYAGICAMSTGKDEQAVEYFLDSAQRGEYASVCMYNAALCAIRLEDYQAAAQHLQAAIDANDDEEAVKEAKELLVQVRNYRNE